MSAQTPQPAPRPQAPYVPSSGFMNGLHGWAIAAFFLGVLCVVFGLFQAAQPDIDSFGYSTGSTDGQAAMIAGASAIGTGVQLLIIRAVLAALRDIQYRLAVVTHAVEIQVS